MEAVNVDQLEKSLAENQFLGGQAPTNADRETYEQLKSTPPSAQTHPHTFAWFILVGRFVETVRATWGAGQAAPAKGEKKAAVAKPEVKKEEPKKEEAKKPAADDDMDLFGDDDADDEEAKKALAEQKAKMAEPPKKKGVVIAKSLILFEVKPYEAETDLDALAAKVLKIEMDGLLWKTEYKKEPIAYGVHKLIVGCVVEDEKVAVDDLQEKIEAFEDEVQSVDIALFNKI